MARSLSSSQTRTLYEIRRLFVNSKARPLSIQNCVDQAKIVLGDKFDSPSMGALSNYRKSEGWDAQREDEGTTIPPWEERKSVAPVTRPVPGAARPVPAGGTAPVTEFPDDPVPDLTIDSVLDDDFSSISNTITEAIGVPIDEESILSAEQVDIRSIAVLVLESVAMLARLNAKAKADMESDELTFNERLNLMTRLLSIQKQLLSAGPLLAPYIEQFQRDREATESNQRFAEIISKLDALAAMFPDVYGPRYALSLDIDESVNRLLKLQTRINNARDVKADLISAEIDAR